MVNSRAGPSTLPRGRKTPRSVHLIDCVAGVTIRCGGIFVILAVLGICIFLVHVVVPLFGGASVGEPASFTLPRGAGDLLLAEVNEYRSLGLALYRDGTVHVFDARSGSVVREARVVPGDAVVKAFSRSGQGGNVAFGLEDGRILLGRISFNNSFIDHVPQDGHGGAAGSAALDSLPVGGSVPYEGGVAEKTPLGQLRHSAVEVAMQEPVPLGSGTAAVSLVSYSVSDSNEVIVGLSDDGQLIFSTVSKKQSLLDGSVRVKLKKYSIPYENVSEPPARLLLNARGDQLFLAWRDGSVHRYDLRSPDTPVLAERTNVCAEGASLTSLVFMLGDQSILVGDSSGVCTAWFRVPAEDAAAYPDGYRMVPAHRMESQGSPVTALAVSPRDKTFVSGSADGSIWLRHMTSERALARVAEGGRGGRGIALLQIAPKADGILAVLDGGRASVWPYTSPHPETTPGTIFEKVWYEGYEAPVHTWQSSSGTDDFEAKFGLVPLIFGTLKATFYALLFAVPIALLAAIYTSEFLNRRTRAVVKPAIEMMASLPSVVLGFLAALVLAPLIENWVVSLLALFFVVPAAMVLASYLWLFLPQQWSSRLEGLPKLALSTVVFLAAVLAAFPLGLWLESELFLGDFRAWLAPPRAGSGAPFWAGLLLLPSLLVTLFAYRRWALPLLRRKPARLPPWREALRDLIRGVLILAASIALASAAGLLLDALGMDPRDSLVGTYVQRNTLIVGFVMGFAVIPIIYTLAEDALSSVPEHLRGAALGCGATPWQTAVRVILPTAASGIFSAVMIGLGRAVGETMIVVMAAGNTPIMDVSPFNGLRALSATIAVELPEAVKDGTLYRMLFLAALTLFLVTFVVNTLAELVRMRFRKKAFEL